MSLAAERSAALAAVRLACRITEHVRATDVVAVSKDDASPVTTADYAAQATVNKELQKTFPHDAMISEEQSKQLFSDDPAQVTLRAKVLSVLNQFDASVTEADFQNALDYGKFPEGTSPTRFWTLDPVDGTKGFLRNDQYAIALGLVEHGRVVLGVLGCPCLPGSFANPSSKKGSIFVATRGEGCFEYPIDDESAAPQKARVSPIADSSQAVILESVEAGHTAHDVSGKVLATLCVAVPSIRMDSQAKYAALARGDGSIYLRLPRPGKRYDECIWDHAAGTLVIEEAGGKVTDVNGVPLDFTKGSKLYANTGIIATNGLLHNAAVEAVQAALKQ